MQNPQPSGRRIFDIIDILSRNPKSRLSISNELKSRGIKADKKTITKYMRTLRAAGFEVQLKDGGFQVFNTPFKLTLNEQEREGLSAFMFLANRFFRGNSKKRLMTLEYKMYSLFGCPDIKAPSEKIEPFYFDYTDEVSENTEKVMKQIFSFPACMRAKYKSKTVDFVPRDIKYKKNGIFLYAFDLKKEENEIYRLDLMSKIKFKKFLRADNNDPNSEVLALPYKKTMFRLTDRLVKNYILRRGEIAHYKEDGVYVTNFLENKEQLFSRLIRYGKYCEVLSPEPDRQYFIKKIKSLIKHYKSI